MSLTPFHTIICNTPISLKATLHRIEVDESIEVAKQRINES